MSDAHAILRFMTIQEPGAGSQSVPPTIEAPQPTPETTELAPGIPTAPATKKPRNILALIALIVSAVGFIFACIPGALILGWVLLPIAFILSIVSLFLKGSGKGLGIAALVVSVVGTVVGFVVFFSVIATSFDDAFGGGDVSVGVPVDSEKEDGGAAPAAAEGTRDNPVALGSPISSDDWTVVVNSYVTDGNATVLASPYNEAAPAGSHYEIVNYTVTYTGDDSAIAAEVGIDFVTSGGNVINSFDNFAILDDSIGIDELFNGASATGSQVFTVPDGETILIRVNPGLFADQIFVKP